MIGTGNDEVRKGISEIKSQLSRDFAQVDEISCAFSNLMVSNLETIAWVSGNLKVDVVISGKKESYHGRLTMVMENRGGKFLIHQSHFSLPYPTQASGQSWPTVECKTLEPSRH